MDVGERVFECGEHVIALDRQPFGQRLGEGQRLRRAVAVVAIVLRGESCVSPQRHAVGTPETGEGPARQRLARVPLALPVVKQAAGREAVAHAPEKAAGQATFGRPGGRGVPLVAVHVVDRHEGGLAAHRQAHVAGSQVGVDAIAERDDVAPLRVGVRLGDARILVDPRHRHLVVELYLARAHQARDRRRRLRVRRCRQRNVSLAREEPGGRVEAHPPRARQVDLGPGVEIGEVLRRAGGAVERLLIGHQLDQIAGHEAGGHAQVPQRFHQQPGGVAAGAAGGVERDLARLHARFHPNQVADLRLDAPVQIDEEPDGVRVGVRKRGQQRGEARARRGDVEERLQLGALQLVVDERHLVGARLQEEVERVHHRHLGHQVHFEREHRRLGREGQPGQVVALRILLPVDEVARRLDAQRVAVHRRPAVRRRPQPDHLRRQRHRAVVVIDGLVVQRDTDSHR